MFPGENQNRPELEAALAEELSSSLEGCTVGDRFSVTASADICSSMELYLPLKLRARYPEWIRESLDGIFVAEAVKTGENSATLAGMCVLISDQTVTPFWVRFQLNSSRTAFDFVQIKVGESGCGSLGISGPACNSREARQMFEALADRIPKISWVYVFESA